MRGERKDINLDFLLTSGLGPQDQKKSKRGEKNFCVRTSDSEIKKYWRCGRKKGHGLNGKSLEGEAIRSVLEGALSTGRRELEGLAIGGTLIISEYEKRGKTSKRAKWKKASWNGLVNLKDGALGTEKGHLHALETRGAMWEISAE